MNVLVFSAMALALGAIARWGLRPSPVLVPDDASAAGQQRADRRRVIRRGARFCWAMSVVFAAFALLNLAIAILT